MNLEASTDITIGELRSKAQNIESRVNVTIDIESEQLAKLSDDQRSAIRENLKTLGFGDDDWSMD